jgi:hypothetical protein
MATTLPEITIVGNPGSTPVTVADWYAEGFTAGWREPNVTPGAPAPLNQETLSAFFAGVTAGSNSRRGIEAADPGDDSGPAAEPDIGGPLFEEVDREYREAFAKFLEHDDPHNEVELPEIEFAR